MNQKYSSKDLCILVPTKDRPKRVSNLLKTLVEQTEQVGKIVIVASGFDIRDVTEEYCSKLSINYYYTEISGQINQRNLGLSKIDPSFSLIAFIDDDIEFTKDAVANLIKFWNTTTADTAGVGFNIINEELNKLSKPMFKLLTLFTSTPGRVLRSGMTTPIGNVKINCSSQWLNGGSTTWRRDILERYIHRGIDCKWSISEDLIFSYPISKNNKLYICADAHVQHHHDNHPKNADFFFLHGKVQTIWVYHFILKNKELSKTLFFLTLFVRMAGKFVWGLIKNDKQSIYFVIGCLSAIGKIIKFSFGFIRNEDIRET